MESTDTTLSESLAEAQAQPIAASMEFRPEYSRMERLMAAIYAYGKQEEDFRAKVRATIMLQRYPDAEAAYANDDGRLEGIWVKLRRLSVAIEKEMKELNRQS